MTLNTGFLRGASMRPGGHDQPMNKGLMAVGAVAIAGLSAAIGWYGVKLLVPADEQAVAEPTGTPTADVDTVPLTFDLAAVEQQASGLFTPPACGEEWSSEPVEANGVIPVVEAMTTQGGASVTTSFQNASTETKAFLAQEGQLIVTRDGVVVTPDWGSEFVPDLYVTTSDASAPTSDTVDFSGAALCDVAGELSAIWDDFDWSSATEEEIAARQQEAEDFEAEHQDLPPGEYQVYAWSPIILGESAAAARALVEEGITDLAYLQYTAGYSPLRDDPRIAEHCEESETPDGQTELLCDVPQDVLTEVLRRDVPTYYVVEAEPAIAISEAATFTVE